MATELLSEDTTATTTPVTSQATTPHRASNTPALATTTAVWNPNDYVDDNYEPHAYIPQVPPLAVLVPHELNKYNKYDRQSKNGLVEDKTHRDHRTSVNAEQVKPTSTSATQTTSSHIAGAGRVPPAASPPHPPLLEAPACATSRSTDCRTRA